MRNVSLNHKKMEKIVIETVMFEGAGSSSNENLKINTLLDDGWIIKEMNQHTIIKEGSTIGISLVFYLKKVDKQFMPLGYTPKESEY